MTTETTSQATTEHEEEQPAQTPEAKQAEADFVAGFAKGRGEKPQADQPDGETTDAAASTEKKGEQAAQTKGAAAAAAAPAKDPWEGVPAVVKERLEALNALPGQIRNLAGHLGGLNSKIDSALATAKAAATDKAGAAAAPSDAQVKAAIANPEAWKKLKEDYPDWAEPLEAEFSGIRKEIAELAKKPGQAVDVNALKSEVTRGVDAALAAGFDAAEERAFVRLKHPDWKTTVNTEEFKAWTLEGGPSLEEYGRMKALEQTDPVKADAMVNGWARQHPQWWADRGAAIFDERADAAIQLLDGFKASREQTASAQQRRQRSESRLERSVPAKSTGGAPPSTGLSDEAHFERGANRVLSQRLGAKP